MMNEDFTPNPRRNDAGIRDELITPQELLESGNVVGQGDAVQLELHEEIHEEIQPDTNPPSISQVHPLEITRATRAHTCGYLPLSIAIASFILAVFVVLDVLFRIQVHAH
jgi:hypothetical protein